MFPYLYQHSNGSGEKLVVLLTATEQLQEGEVSYRVTGLSPGVRYDFTLGGRDVRHGEIVQFLPPSVLRVTLQSSGDDGVDDVEDNCLFSANSEQGDSDDDDIGDACEAG